ncbi:hypothetical protein [Vreelandella sulfidaeris]|uniref:hypothetical protein n=1 Tax=Vreelandella sulfidaeris TaxID=115553 RepID=UPI0035EA2528
MDPLELKRARTNYLNSLQDPQATNVLLQEMLVELEKKVPALLVEYQPESGQNDLDPDDLKWSADYFSRQRFLARQNFSRRRIEHLLEVRAYLRTQGVKGFVPRNDASTSRTARTDSITAHYSPSDNLKKFVNEGELHTIRAALVMELHDNNQTSDDLRAAIDWTKSQAPELFKAYTLKAFARETDVDQTQWSSEYYKKQVVYLEHNFSERRFLHIIDVRERLRQQGVEGFTPLPLKPRTSTCQTSPPSSSAFRSFQPHPDRAPPHQPEHNPILKKALIVGGAIAALAILLITLINGQN